MSFAKILLFVVIAIGLLYGGFLVGRHLDQRAADTAYFAAQEQEQQQKTIMDKLIMTDEVVGSGLEAVAGDTVSVHYAGTLDNGQKFDSSYDRGTPFTFVLGAGQVIEGWDRGVAGMKVGGKRMLTIPPELGYGDRAISVIPANSTLHFTVELLDVKKQ
ncbi:MAG: FKBP-type peptidyl-prolyl cis-trans isomerase [Candidatus Parcubacteria bacterium]|jgi:FKBP-type peptidyl-prolyl cis-trans isomerase